MIYHIYILIDPRTYQIRYVGQTINIKSRFIDHTTKQYGKNRRTCWLNKLRSLNLKPIIQGIEECDETNWADREKYWIRHYRELGCDLVNATGGGEGNIGWIPSEETRRRMSEANKGEKNPNYGKIRSEEHKRKIGEGNKGKTMSAESRRKMSEAKKGKTLSKETRLKLSKMWQGENHPQTKLSEKDAINIINSDLSIKELRIIYDVAYSVIYAIKTNRSWKHLPRRDKEYANYTDAKAT